jgi:uncharacterized protein
MTRSYFEREIWRDVMEQTGERPAPHWRSAWIQTATGVAFHVLDPRVEEVRLRDIAIALGKLCRFGGHVPGVCSYTVAQHSVLVALNVPHRYRVQALLHDAAEAYCVDVPRPLKRALVNYDVVEARIAACIGERFGVELCDLPREVELADNRALSTEKRDLLAPLDWEQNLAAPWMAKITPWGVTDATEAFYNLALKLGLS